MQTCNFGDTYSQGSLFFILICHFLSSPRKTEKPITGLFLLFNHTKSNCRHASETSTHCHCWIPHFKLLKNLTFLTTKSRPKKPSEWNCSKLCISLSCRSMTISSKQSKREGGSQKFQNRKKFLCQRNPFVQMHNNWLSWPSSPSSTNCQSSHCQNFSSSHKSRVQTNVWTTFSSNKLMK